MNKRIYIPIIALILSCTACSTSEKLIKSDVIPDGIEICEDGAVSIRSVFPEMGLVDPHAWVENDTVYVFCGHDMSWRTTDTWKMDRWEIWSSADLINWEHRRDILPTETYIGDQPNSWAGDICKRGDKFYWFFSNAHHNTGVMEASSITGKYVDILGEPLLPTDIIKGKPYDPEIFIEDGVYTICFSAGTYYMATLSEDMKSLTTKPKPVLVMKNGKKVATQDKSTLYKRGDWYYLLYGNNYAMSKNLYGPYELQDEKVAGGHNSIFELNGQHYIIYEFGETYMFYRGVGMKPIYFNEDGTISVYKSKIGSRHKGKGTDFKYSSAGWEAEFGTTSLWNNDGYIAGEISEKGAMISSVPYLGMETSKAKSISFKLKNNTSSTRARIYLSTFDTYKAFWQTIEPIEWDTVPFVDVEIKANTKEYQTVSVKIESFSDLKNNLRQIRIAPAYDASSGSWEIDDISIF